MDNYAYNISSSYPESGNSSPRSREIEFENPSPWEDASQQTTLPANFKVKFMCSYGGKIQPRPHDNLLSYIGGETKILAVDRSIKFASLLSKLITLCEDDTISFKYQLPGEDLDSLISVTSDDDLEHMMQEYDRLYRISPKPARLRLFVFPNQNPSRNSSIQSFGSEDGVRISEKERFVEALNSAPLMTPTLQPHPPLQPLPVTNNVDFLFGTEKATGLVDPVQVQVPGFDDPIQKHIHDLQRLRLEEQQATNYRRKSEDNNLNAGEYYRVQQEKVAVSGGVPYGVNNNYTDQQQQQQQVYMVPAPTNAYHTPVQQMVRQQVSGVPTNQGYYAMQRMPSPEMFRDPQQQQQQQQQQMYNMMPSSGMMTSAQAVHPQKVVNFSEGYGMVRQTSGGGVGPVMPDPTTYGQMAYDGRQVMYNAPQVQYHHQPTVGHVSAEMRPGALITEAGGKVVAGRTTTQASV